MSQKILRIGDLIGIDKYTKEFYFKKPRIEQTDPSIVLLSDSNRLYVYTLDAIVILTPLGDKMRVDIEQWGFIGNGEDYEYFYNNDFEKVMGIAVTIDGNHNPKLLEEIREALRK
uniref:Uncharacterized protein n=1 Tax=archaeon enrichment culture clone 1(2010) TaxID=795325 RepID=D9CGG3_9ARCH|nr:hypothetical protein pHA1_gp39 [archaeon enrichment culture clone 1(2010)]